MFQFKKLDISFVQLCEILGIHSGINNLRFLLLDEALLLCKWLEIIRYTVLGLTLRKANFEGDSAD